MSRKPLRRQRTGYGAFSVSGSAPAIVSLCAEPLHTSDEWESKGRPFWCVWWWGGHVHGMVHTLGSLYGRTMTPTFCPLGVVGVPPTTAAGVSVGACDSFRDGDWVEYYTYAAAERSVRGRRKFNPVVRVSWDRALTVHTYQWYATDGDISTAQATPVRPADAQWKPPPELLRLGDDGCPHVEVPERDDSIGDD